MRDYLLMSMFLQSCLIFDVKGKPALKYCLLFCLWAFYSTVVLADESGEPHCPEIQPVLARPHDDVWLLSCRSLGCPEKNKLSQPSELTEGLVTWQYDLTDKKWNRLIIDELLNSNDNIRTVVWVHGNLTTASEAFSTGLSVYRSLVRDAEDQPPIRFIIWSWPASKILTRPVPDARIKAARTTWAGLRLAGLLQQISGNKSNSLIGFSFGAQVVVAALELLSGGELNQTKINSAGIQTSYHVTLFAAALDSYWLLPDRRFGQALEVVDHLTLVNNYCDWVLKHYGKIYCHCARRGPSALGYTGLPVSNLPKMQQEKIEQFNASGVVGKQHALRPYIESSTTMNLIRKGTIPDWDEDVKLNQ